MTASAWFPMYPGDYLRATGHLTLPQHGAYSVLLLNYYATGTLPADAETLCRIARAFSEAERDAVATVVAEFFDADGDRLRHPRADREIAKQAEFHAERSESGKRGATSRWGKHGSANGSAIAQPMATTATTRATEKRITTSSSDAEAVGRRLAKEFLALLLKLKPDLRQPNIASWAKHFDCMVRLDNRDPERIRTVMNWVTRHPFWQSKVLSAEKLRKQFDQLEMQMKGAPKIERPDEREDDYAGLVES
jgi:uncharacterized protein YdaU (DUF1376 family)